MSALPPKADIGERYQDVRFVPEADVSNRHKDKDYSITSSTTFNKPSGTVQ